MTDFLKNYSLEIAVLISAIILSASMLFFVGMPVTNLAETLKTGTGTVTANAQIPTGSGQTATADPRATIEYNGEPIRGGKDAKVTIYEFSDFQCPFCKKAHPTVQQVMQKYGSQVKLVYKHFPLDFHVAAQKAAEAYECAIDQNKGWEMHDKMFEVGQADGTALAVADLKQYARELGMNGATFDSCLDSGSKASIVQRDASQLMTIAQSGKFADFQQGIGTPTFFINGKPLVGAQPIEAFTQAIDAELAK